MLKLFKTHVPVNLVVVFALLVLVFASPVYAFETNSARIMPTGKVLLYQADKLAGEITSEAPLPFNTDLTVSGKCGIKMNGLYLVAADKAKLAIDTDATDHIAMQFRQGKFYFALSSLPYPLLLKTPDGDFSIDQVLLNASSDGSLLQGFVNVKQDETAIGVFDGGSLIVSSDYGASTIPSGKQITIAQNTANAAPIGAADAGEAEAANTPAKGKKKLSTLTIGAIGAGVVGIAAIAAGSSGGGGSSSPASPSEPE